MSNSVFDLTWKSLLPIAFLTFLLEIYHFLDCAPEDGERSKKQKENHVDIAKLKISYRQYNELHNIMADTIYLRHEFTLRNEMHQTIENCEESSNPEVISLLDYLKYKGVSHAYPSQCIDTAIRLVEGESIFYATPFYKDIDVCIFFPIYLAILRNEKALILLEDNENLEEVRSWIKSGVESIHDLTDMWNISIIDDIVDDAEVGLLSFQNIFYQNDIEGLEDFLNQVSYVAVLEASDMLVGGQEAVSFMASMIGKNVRTCTWLLCDRNAESMLDLYSHLIKKEFLYVSATPLRAEETAVIYWNAENDPPLIWNPVQRYLGIEAGILEVAGINRIQNIKWYGEELCSVFDLQWIYGQYYIEYAAKISNTPHQISMNECLDCSISGISCGLEDEQFIIVEDINCNLVETARQYATRAEKSCFIHVISFNYMLRDFMKDREKELEADPKYIAQFVPEYADSLRNSAIFLIRKMLSEPVSEEQIDSILNRSTDSTVKTGHGIERIRELVNMVLNMQNAVVKITYKNVFSEKQHMIKQERYYFINDIRVSNEFSKYFQKASYIDEAGNKKHISKVILAGHLEQKYLPGQFITLAGKYYEVKGFASTDIDKSLVVLRASEQITGRLFYRQVRAYRLRFQENSGFENRVVYRNSDLCVTHRYADIEAETTGYMKMNRWNDVAGGTFVPSHSGAERRRYMKKQILEINCGTQADNSVCVSLALIFQEMFCTFYPQYYHLLSVAVNFHCFDSLSTELPSGEVLSRVLASVDCCTIHRFYIIEDSREDMGLLRSIERNFQRMLNIAEEYVQWSLSSQNNYLKYGE